MPMEIQQLVNSPMLWMITLMSIALVLGMAAYFLVKSIKVAKSIGVTKEQISITVKTAGISAVAPSVVIAVGMISLLVMVGAPTALLRLSVVGNVGYELQSVGIAADAFGTTASAATLTPGIFQTTVFLMAFGCIGYLVIPALLCTKMDKVIRKISGKDATVATIISTAAILGCYAYVDAPYILKMDASTVALAGGFAVMLLLQAIQKRTRKKWLLEWGLLSSMSAGMCLGLFV